MSNPVFPSLSSHWTKSRVEIFPVLVLRPVTQVLSLCRCPGPSSSDEVTDCVLLFDLLDHRKRRKLYTMHKFLVALSPVRERDYGFYDGMLKTDDDSRGRKPGVRKWVTGKVSQKILHTYLYSLCVFTTFNGWERTFLIKNLKPYRRINIIPIPLFFYYLRVYPSSLKRVKCQNSVRYTICILWNFTVTFP